MGENVCSQCGAAIPSGWPACPDCGAAPPARRQGGTPDQQEVVRTGRRESDSPAADTFPELAGANLSRIRGSYAEAERQCQAVLARFSDHPAPHSLLGEIFEDQGRFAEAVTEYQLALELDPTNENDRRLLARAMQRQAGGAPSEPFAANAAMRREFGIRTSSPWLPVAVVAFLCLGLIAFLIVRTHPASPVPGHGITAGSTDTVNPYPAAVDGAKATTSTPQPGSGGVQPAGGSLTGTAAAAAGDSGTVGDPGAGAAAGHPVETAEEAAILQSVAAAGRQSSPPFSVDSVQTDPRISASYARITAHVSTPLAAGARDAVARVAAGVAGTAAAIHLTFVTVRVTGAVGSGPPSLLFMAEAAPSSFQNVEPASVQSNSVSSLFQNAWWSPALPGG